MHPKQWRQGLLVGVLLIVSLWLVSLIWGLAGKAEVAVRQAHEAQSAYKELEARKATLAQNLAANDTPRGKDAAIRQAFGVAKPGEEVIVVVPPVAPTTTPSQSWWEWLFGWF